MNKAAERGKGKPMQASQDGGNIACFSLDNTKRNLYPVMFILLLATAIETWMNMA